MSLHCKTLLVLFCCSFLTLNAQTGPDPENDPFAAIDKSDGFGERGCSNEVYGEFGGGVIKFHGDAIAANTDVFPMPNPFKIKGVLEITAPGISDTLTVLSQQIFFNQSYESCPQCSTSTVSKKKGAYELSFDVSSLNLPPTCEDGAVIGFTADLTLYGYWDESGQGQDPGNPLAFPEGEVDFSGLDGCNQWWPDSCFNIPFNYIEFDDICLECGGGGPPQGPNRTSIIDLNAVSGGEGFAKDQYKNDANNDLAIVPNPASDLLNIVIQNEKEAGYIELFDIWGNLMNERYNISSIGNDHIKLNIDHFPNGQYIVVYRGEGNRVSTYRFIKNR